MLLGDGLVIAAATTWLPPGRETVADAIAEGKVKPERAADLALTAVPAGDVPAPELAARAAEAALTRAGVPRERVGLLVHAWIYHQGHDLWSPAHYVADRAGVGAALPVGLYQLCNGGAGALAVAATHLLADPGLDTALVTTGDRFAPPGFDRWTSDYSVAYGDGGTAVVLRRGPAHAGDLVLLGLAQASAPEFETMYRGRDEFSPAPRWHSDRVDARRAKKAFLAEKGIDRFNAVSADRIRRVVTDALSGTGIAPTDPRIRYIALPRLADSSLDASYVPVLDGWVPGKLISPREHSGHLGAGDTAANLAHLHDNRLLDRGEVALVLLSGGGFSWSCAVVTVA
ncbi:3-oxoacyl-ACP synthase [Actinophytocola oryzae]|uniref:3-oxoacyl-[acyl-carrier-protein] synthase-3 n=1 Tax=Actinophytocola oryzae TaxID=502181 RepID=A0A4R7VW29_9PSEU|nr:3-oxoacyl-ACP synthase [Actinophytocola oryzae]TDV54246.1 3-oxoacyl-[acyl-carrier-protein] synthase-3 [Actinophytocola oryzae]